MQSYFIVPATATLIMAGMAVLQAPTGADLATLAPEPSMSAPPPRVLRHQAMSHHRRDREQAPVRTVARPDRSGGAGVERIALNQTAGAHQMRW